MDANNFLKRQPSYDALDESLHKAKRKKILFDNSSSPDAYSDLYALSVSHLPPSPPTFTDTPLPLPLPASPTPSSPSSLADLIPILKRFTISTRQPQQSQLRQQDQQLSLSYYTNINQILCQAHMERPGSHSSNIQTMDYCANINYYGNANMILRQAFLQRHPPST